MFFDCLNVTTTYQGVKSKSQGVNEPDDWRFKVFQVLKFFCHFKSGEDMLDRVGTKGLFQISFNQLSFDATSATNYYG